jgi:hypothetical protein
MSAKKISRKNNYWELGQLQVLRIRNVFPRSRIRIFHFGSRIRIFHPRSKIQGKKDSGSRIRIHIKKGFLTQKIVYKLSVSGIWYGMFIPEPDHGSGS